MTPPVDSTAVPIGDAPGTRRRLRFDSADAMLADARALAAARIIERIGNWTLGQALNHIAAWIEFPYRGYPMELVIPEHANTATEVVKARIMRDAMAPGEKLPGPAAGTFVTEIVPDAQGLARLESAAAHLKGDPSETAPIPDPFFGIVTRHEWSEISLRHAELHLSFFRAR